MNARDSVLIVGAGVAGLYLALKLKPRPTIVLSPAPLGQTAASTWAQGGLAAALAPDDSPALHAEDTVKAGAGLVDPVVARLIADEGPARVIDLLELGVPFDRSEDGQLARGLEAAHSRPRVVRVSGDLAGKAIMDALISAVRAASHIEIVEGFAARTLLQDAKRRVVGVACIDAEGARADFTAAEIVLATGGVGGLFAITTNPRQALGDGLAMAARAGAPIADPEFVQFHPTAIDVGRDPAPLATEALRGDGALLVNRDGERFVSELAPRDVVARAIQRERVAGRGAFLDARENIGAAFPTRFPTVFAACMSAGLDPRIHPIPVGPGAHYHMGGVVSDLWGRAALEGLGVVGECASTGAHGANRLASNSLLESVVFAWRIAERLRGSAVPSAPLNAVPTALPPALPDAERALLRGAMQTHVGVARNADGLQWALDEIDKIESRVGTANEIVAARLIAGAALAREESRGAHFRSDFPEPGAALQRTFIFERNRASHASSAA
jgi:L-aspartate oxidase